MTQCHINNEDLNIVFQETNEVPIVLKLDNGSEFDFVDDELVNICLPNFLRQIPNNIQFEEICFDKITWIDDNVIKVELYIILPNKQRQSININVDISSL